LYWTVPGGGGTVLYLHVRAPGRHPRSFRGSEAGQRRPQDVVVEDGNDGPPGSSPETLPCSQAPPGQGGFTVEVCDGEPARVVVTGELDGAALAPFEDALAELLESGRPIVLDLSRLTFIDSCGLWAVTLTQRICRQRGIRLLIEPGPERVHSVFEVTGLADLLPFAPASPAASGDRLSLDSP
jgi:anti-sigma B factor antagonist